MDEESRQPKPAPASHSATRIARNVFSNWGSFGFSMAVNFFVAPIVVGHLGNAGYGVWTLVVSLTGYLGLLDFGVRGAVTRYTARFHTQGDHDRAGGVASSALAIFAAAGFLAILIALVVSVLFLDAFNIPHEYLRSARIVLILTGISVAVSLVTGVFGGILVGLQRFDLQNALEVAVAGMRAATIVLVLRSGRGIVALAAVQLAFTLVRGVAAIVISFRQYPELRIGPAKVKKEHLRLIASFSMFSFLYYVGTNLVFYTDSVVIGAFLPVGMITFFAIGASLVEYSRALVTGISQTMSPLASSLEARGDEEGLRRSLLFGCRTATMVMLPVATTFMIRGGSFIGLWMGPQYAEPSGRVLWVLSLTMLLWPAGHLASSVMFGISKHKPLVPLMLAEGLTNLALSVAWIRSAGILGVAWGTVVPSLASSLVFWPWYVRRTLGIRVSAYVVSSWVRPGVAIVPFALASLAVEKLWPASKLFVFLLQVGSLLPLVLLTYWLVCLDRDQRESIRQRVLRAIARNRSQE
jgi:O-antigen/teichoic acid export membrane protein